MPVSIRVSPKALRTQEKWGCKKVPCAFLHSIPQMRQQKGWKQAHTRNATNSGNN